MAQIVSDAKVFMDKVSSIKNDDNPNRDKNRATVAGGTVGLLIGIYYGYSKKKNVMICALIGGGLGAIISRLSMPK